MQLVVQTLSMEEVVPFWSFELLYNFLTQNQLYSSFLLSD